MNPNHWLMSVFINKATTYLLTYLLIFAFQTKHSEIAKSAKAVDPENFLQLPSPRSRRNSPEIYGLISCC